MDEILYYVWITAYAAERNNPQRARNSVEDCANLADKAVEQAVKRFPRLKPQPSESTGFRDGQ